MLTLLIAAAATAQAAPTAPTVHRINQDGVRASFSRSVDSDGTVHLRGVTSGRERNRFHYRVVGNNVLADIEGVTYVFAAPRAR